MLFVRAKDTEFAAHPNKCISNRTSWLQVMFPCFDGFDEFSVAQKRHKKAVEYYF